MKKVLSSIGIGSASVDLVLPKTTVQPGETLDAELRIEGGSTDQEVEQVKYAIRTKSYDEEDGTRTVTIEEGTLMDGFLVAAGESRTEDVVVDIPVDTPTTLGKRPVWIDTALDIEMAVDPDDEDRIEVEPRPKLRASITAMESLGFELHTVENEAVGRSNFKQEFEFRPRRGQFVDDLDEVDVVPTYSDGTLYLSIEVDRSGGLLSEMADTDESRDRVTVEAADPAAIEPDLRRTIEKHS